MKYVWWIVVLFAPSSLFAVVHHVYGVNTIKLRKAEVSLERVVVGHNRDIILTAVGQSLSGPIYLRLKYPDTPKWHKILDQCKKVIESLGPLGVEVGPVHYKGQTLTRLKNHGENLDQWRSWYGNRTLSMFSRTPPLCAKTSTKRDF